MIAYTSMFLPLTDDHLRGLYIHEQASKRAPARNVAYVADVMVEKAHRGRGLQRRLAVIRQMVTRELDRSHHFATNNFGNLFSWRNTLDSGWRIGTICPSANTPWYFVAAFGQPRSACSTRCLRRTTG